MRSGAPARPVRLGETRSPAELFRVTENQDQKDAESGFHQRKNAPPVTQPYQVNMQCDHQRKQDERDDFLSRHGMRVF